MALENRSDRKASFFYVVIPIRMENTNSSGGCKLEETLRSENDITVEDPSLVLLFLFGDIINDNVHHKIGPINGNF